MKNRTLRRNVLETSRILMQLSKEGSLPVTERFRRDRKWAWRWTVERESSWNG
ncbi:hypothetical protein BX666DRAFT_1932989 [Dichotomocladium elegans]|nr:hypothetical protein BX666DRAFT_1932989 [Dichotomocladium elegans]